MERALKMCNVGCGAVVLLVLLHISAVDGLNCYDCSWSKMESDNILLKPFLKAARALSDDSCRFLEDDDKYQVDQKTCVPAGPGKVNKCALVEGKVDSMIDIKITEINLKYTSVTRNCITVNEDDAEFSDGCHEDPVVNDVIRGLLDQATGSTDLAELKFKGKACYEKFQFTSAGSRVTNVVQHLVSSVILALVAALFV